MRLNLMSLLSVVQLLSSPRALPARTKRMSQIRQPEVHVRNESLFLSSPSAAFASANFFPNLSLSLAATLRFYW